MSFVGVFGRWLDDISEAHASPAPAVDHAQSSFDGTGAPEFPETSGHDAHYWPCDDLDTQYWTGGGHHTGDHGPFWPGHWCPDDLHTLEQRQLDGSYNNVFHTHWGAAGTNFIRLTPAAYDDHISTPIAPRTNYRELSNDIIRQDGDIPNSAGVSDLFTFFGQFIDHDIDIALEGTEEGPHVTAPDNDLPAFQGVVLGIERSIPSHGSGTGPDNPRQHPNAITSFIDASNVYGSSDAVLESLRDPYQPWLLAMTANGDLLPLSDGPNPQFLAGDIRAGENSALTSIHTIWAMEHNRIANALREEHPYWTADQIFDAAKITVEALMQHIVFNEWLPLLVGPDAIPDYSGYDSYVDATISHEFATAAFRFGHSLLSSTIERTEEDGSPAGDLQLAQMFFNAFILLDAGSIDTLVRGLAGSTAQELDHHLVEDVRSLLFPGPDGIQVRDLSVLNNLRNLDHGLGSLNEVREALGLDRYESFVDLTGDQELADALAVHYGSIDDVDLWIGGLLEPHLPGSQLGPTFQHIVVDQFLRLRDGDRFYFEERLEDHPELLAEILNTTFSDIILRNTDIEYLQDDAFIAHTRIAGDDGDGRLASTPGHDLLIGFGGHDFIMAQAGDDDIYAGAGHDYVWGGDGNDIIVGEEGYDWLHGGQGRDTFVFESGSGRDKVRDFNVDEDVLDISDYGFDSMVDVYDAAHVTDEGVLIELDHHTHDSVHLDGVALHQLSASNFIFDHNDGLVV